MAEEKQQLEKSSVIESATPKKSSTLSFLNIDHFREGVMVLRDGSMRMVLRTSAVNFELKAEIERNSIIYGYQNFLNSLDFPIQIIVQSRMLDLDSYLKDLRGRSEKAGAEILKMQINDYVEFVESVIKVANIMQKRFYVVVPHYPGGFKKIGALGKFLNANNSEVSVNDFDTEKKYLAQKTATVVNGLQGIGVRAIQLSTQELIELYYGVYNPEQSVNQKLIDISQLESEIIGGPPEMNI